MSRPIGPWGVFRWPLAIGLCSGVGLVAALLVEGAADLPWTVAIALPLAVIGVGLMKLRRR